MTVLVAASVAAAMLAAGSGLAKVLRPSAAVGAMRAVGLPASTGLVRGLAVLEGALGVAVLAGGSAAARGALALAYAGFAVFALASIRRGATAPCGCFGVGRAPAGWRHVAFDSAFAAALVATVLPGGTGFDPTGARSAVVGALVLVVGAASAALAAVLLSRAAPR